MERNFFALNSILELRDKSFFWVLKGLGPNLKCWMCWIEPDSRSGPSNEEKFQNSRHNWFGSKFRPESSWSTVAFTWTKRPKRRSASTFSFLLWLNKFKVQGQPYFIQSMDPHTHILSFPRFEVFEKFTFEERRDKRRDWARISR